MDFNFDDDVIKEYEPLYELGLIHNNPAVKVLTEFQLTPVMLATLTTGLFETVMRSVPECAQNEYEKHFLKAFRLLMKDRHNYEVHFKEYLDEE